MNSVLDELIKDSDNIDALLELAGYTRVLITHNDTNLINQLIGDILNNKLFSAFDWFAATFAEELEKSELHRVFAFKIGNSIEDYDEFTTTISEENTPCETASKKKLDNNGEDSTLFINILIHRTKYKGIFLVSEESFDTQDKDSIIYSLLFTNDIEKYIKTINDNNQRQNVHR